jgi:menaquinone-dependent protoporphyrinogen oxidase
MSTTPNILIAYASTHGQTALIASRMQESLERRDIHITLVNLKERPAPELYQFDGVILGASIIARGHQPAVVAYIRNHRDELNRMRSSFFSVSASAGSANEKGRAAARRVRDEFLLETGFNPSITESIAGAIKYTRYNYLLRWYMKKASRMNGGSTDTSRDHEYTDWNQVESFSHRFAILILQHPLVATEDASRLAPVPS